jgi:hypothetical protein
MKSNKRQVEKGEEMKENSKNGNAGTGFLNFYFKYTFFSLFTLSRFCPVCGNQNPHRDEIIMVTVS